LIKSKSRLNIMRDVAVTFSQSARETIEKPVANIYVLHVNVCAPIYIIIIIIISLSLSLNLTLP
jgi:ABC-type antimicrobial peptide transport system permease subunit